ncbi:DUF456 domain-containing protein [Pontiella agarivorans]|uniref:DUF456 domain-containing protein n=1 Tax=Pontiella agarivorans TaxID=3038953 RepID=A0ABU5N1Z8_9BACT|nr:DUF456 domain-containing protein [Pontiella agarivorans]MDZ8120455.1 DUF456 domain-containing protein [Pontiella agarivorans]
MELDWHTLSTFGSYSAAALLCILGFVLSCLSLSGTWLVLTATGLVAWSRWPGFPGPGTLILFIVLCIGVEVLEAFAGAWGVQKRGGSKATGWAAVGGGFLGMILGGFIPLPILGNLMGMFAGSFGLAFLVEHNRIKKANHAAHVATGAVLARLGVIFLKVGITIFMTLFLAFGIALTTK